MIHINFNKVYLEVNGKLCLILEFGSHGLCDTFYLYNFRRQRFLVNIATKYYDIRSHNSIKTFTTMLMSGFLI